ncbi:unnamed protein product [Clavelina lepadiformis]|uniref:Kinesin-like protein n=1 Tax=Clavelina lepadiformis TaxID=159417 RepID=A0ABP0FMK8_CLALP
MSNRVGSTSRDEKIHVTVRCRPTNQSERQHRVRKVVECNSKAREVHVSTATTSMGLSAAQQTKVYNFDKVFGQNSTQLDVYRNVVESQLKDVLSGYNCTVLAYGQTGTGKTYTMEGERTREQDYSWDTDPRAGIVPRALSQLFDCLEKAGSEFSVRVSLLEIYNEEIYDLLSHSSEVIKMKIYEDHNRKGSVVVSGLTEVPVRHKSDVYSILEQGAVKRRTAATDLNEFSSRSHSVFSVTVHTKDVTQNRMEEEELVKIGKLNLVDLAGSENIGRSGAVDKRAREAGNINTSLLTLGRCITALVDRAPHIPYRESKLTRLLQDSLGGATKTSIIATISPGSDNLEETLSTLDYAARAKNIHNKPRVNQKLTKRALIKEYDDEIERLRREVAALREKNGIYVDPKQYEMMVAKIEELTTLVDYRQEEAEKFQELFKDSQDELNERTEQLKGIQEDLEQTKQMFAEQSHLKEVYKEHGAHMVDHATELVGTVSEVTGDISKVHDKVERAKNINKNNVNTLRSYSGRIKEDFHLLCDGTMGIFHQNKQGIKKLLSGFDKISKDQVKMFDTISAQVLEWKEAMATMHRETNDRLDLLTKKSLEQSNEHNDALVKQKENMTSQMDKYNDNMIKFDDVTKGLLKMVEMIKQSTDFNLQQAQKQGELINSHEEELVGQFQALKDSMDNMVDARKADLKDLEATVTAKISKMFSNFDVDLDQTNQKTAEIQKSAADFRTQLQSNSAETVKNVKHLDQEITSTANQCTSVINDTVSVANDNVISMRDSLKKHNEQIAEICHSMQQDNAATLQECGKKLRLASKSASRFEANCCTSLSDFKQDVDQEVEGLKEIVDEIEERMDVGQESIADGKQSISETVDECFIEKCQHLNPTGTTPARKTYDYSSRIRPQPHEEDVLVNFRGRILEEDESTEEEATLEEEEEESTNSGEETDEGLMESNFDRSITIPDVGGLPFFKKKKGRHQKTHNANNNRTPATRIPFRSTQNIDH